MKRTFAISCLPLCIAVLGASFQMSDAAATMIPGSGITVTVSSLDPTGYSTQGVVNGAGLNATTGVHNNSGGAGDWYQNKNNARDQAFITFDLGALYTLDSIHVWNASQYPTFGIATLDVYVSTMATPGDPEGAGAANWTKIGNNVSFLQAPATNNTGFDFETQTGILTLGSTAVRHVRFEANSTFQSATGNGYVGLSEVQFFAVPEPSTALLGAFGLLALLRRRR